MTAKEIRRILKAVADDTNILVGTVDIKEIKKVFSTDRKMQLSIIPK